MITEYGETILAILELDTHFTTSRLERIFELGDHAQLSLQREEAHVL